MSDYISRETLIGKVEKCYCAPCKGQDGDLGGDWCRFCVIHNVLKDTRNPRRRCGAGAAWRMATCSQNGSLWGIQMLRVWPH